MDDVLVTGAFGRVGTALIEHLPDAYDLSYLDKTPHDDYDAHVADITDYDTIRPAFDGRDAVVHLAANPSTDASWQSVFENNVLGTYNVLEAARDAGVETFVFASSNHVVGGYEDEFAPDLYEPEFGLVVDHTDPIRPDSLYGSSKAFGEAMGRQYVDQFESPTRFYALRIASVRAPEYDHPFGDAERGVDEGEWERGDPEYERALKRLRATWLSRRDTANLVDCCLRSESPEFGVYYGVSDNAARWFDLEHARAELGFRPEDSADEWAGPPETGGEADA